MSSPPLCSPRRVGGLLRAALGPDFAGKLLKWVWLCLAALGCADGDVRVGDVQPLVEPVPDGGFITFPLPGSLDAAVEGERDLAFPDAADQPPPQSEARPGDPPPPAGACRNDADCPEGRICVGDSCVLEPGSLQPVGNGACTNAADEAQIGNGLNLRELATACTVGCLGQEICVVDCVKMNTRFSPACGLCVGQLVACILTACFVPCTLGEYLTCLDCREAACDAAFEQCSGYRVPQGW